MRLFLIFLVTILFLESAKSNNLNIIRDAETENLLKEISSVLIKDNQLV